MDLDGTWTGDDTTGKYTAHSAGTGDIEPDIWVGRIATNKLSSSQTGKTEGNLLVNYFTRNHNYRTGTLSLPQHKGLIYNSSDKNLKEAYFSPLPSESSTNFLGELSTGYEWTHLEGSSPAAKKPAEKFVFANSKEEITYKNIKRPTLKLFFTLYSALTPGRIPQLTI